MDSPLLDLGRERIVKGRGLYITLSRAERLRAARGVPQAIVKVTGFGRGARGVKDAMAYISREGEFPFEKDSGELIQGLDEQRELVNEWSIDFKGPRRSRDSAQIVFSMPPGSSVESLKAAVRATGAKAFPDNEWVFGIHTDTKHPHAHMVVKMRGMENGKKLRLRKADLYELRTIFAEAAREQGVQLAASPRAARGIGRKGMRQAIYQLKNKGVKPKRETQTFEKVLDELGKGDWKEKPWEVSMRRRNGLERQAYREESEKLRTEAFYNVKDRNELLKAAADLEQFSRNMPTPKTKHQFIKERIWQKTLAARKEQLRIRGREEENER